MKRIICILIGIIFSVITTAVFFYCLMLSVRALIGGGLVVTKSDLWIFYAIVFPAALVFAFVANYLYDKPILTEKNFGPLHLLPYFVLAC